MDPDKRSADPSSLLVRRLGPQDAQLVLAARELFGALDERAVKEHLSSESDHVIVAFQEGEPAAFLRAHELPRLDGAPKILLYAIETIPRCRRRGFARALIEALKDLARRRGARSVFVLTSEANEPAMRLYEATGAVRPHQDDVIWTYEL